MTARRHRVDDCAPEVVVNRPHGLAPETGERRCRIGMDLEKILRAGHRQHRLDPFCTPASLSVPPAALACR